MLFPISILFPVFSKAREKARQTACINNQKQIVTGALIYSQENEEVMPDNLDQLGIPAKVFVCPTAGKNAGYGYGYNSEVRAEGLGMIPKPETVICTTDSTATDKVLDSYTKIDNRHAGKAIASYCDGHVEMPSDGILGYKIGNTLFTSLTMPPAGWTVYDDLLITPTATPTKASMTSATVGEVINLRSNQSAAKYLFPAAVTGNFKLEFDCYIAAGTKGSIMGFVTGGGTPAYTMIARSNNLGDNLYVSTTTGYQGNHLATPIAVYEGQWIHAVITRKGDVVSMTATSPAGTSTVTIPNTSTFAAVRTQPIDGIFMLVHDSGNNNWGNIVMLK